MSRLTRLRSFAVLMAVLLATSACASSGALLLGSIMLKDGSSVEYVQVKTKGQSGPDVTVVEGFRTTGADNKSEKITSYSGSSPGMAEVIAGGLAGSVPLAGGMIGGAAALRPSRTNVSVSGVSEGGKASAFQLQGQGQGQGQGQFQSQGQDGIIKEKIK